MTHVAIKLLYPTLHPEEVTQIVTGGLWDIEGCKGFTGCVLQIRSLEGNTFSATFAGAFEMWQSRPVTFNSV